MKPTIVIVSDDLLFWNLFAYSLSVKTLNLQIYICKSFDEVIENESYKDSILIIVDGGFSDMSSITVIQFLRMQKRTVSPIWFFPEIQTKECLYKSQQIGVSRIILKPFDPILISEEIILLLTKQTI